MLNSNGVPQWLHDKLNEHSERLQMIEDRVSQLWGWRVLFLPIAAAIVGAMVGWLLPRSPWHNPDITNMTEQTRNLNNRVEQLLNEMDRPVPDKPKRVGDKR